MGLSTWCEAWRSPSEQLFRNAWSMRHIIFSSHRLRARCSVGVKQQSLSVAFWGSHNDLYQSRIWPFVFQPIDFPNLCCWRAWFCEMRIDGKCSGLLAKGAEKRNLSEDSWHHFSRPDCWSECRFLVVMHLHVFLPAFLLLAMYVGSLYLFTPKASSLFRPLKIRKWEYF